MPEIDKCKYVTGNLNKKGILRIPMQTIEQRKKSKVY